ncbi:paraquat-inducible protein A [Luteibacter sahnii]|uniref:paraquat-inducible protein A n=1 Tax=Luteibacter sahnii TaxID=3021977 RepID=UPI002A6AA959|nr:paraquat-inducible protein A [Luteibacter sp. PPL193]MDY1547696.1 paraquat-inducible protein A [Luteibacter sp. PPL193]
MTTSTLPSLVICEHCDSVYHRAPLTRGQRARCALCGASLYRHSRASPETILALSIASAIVFLIANVYPVVEISLQGMANGATLWQAVLAMASGEAAPIAVPVALCVIIVPGLQIGLLGWISAYATAGRPAPGGIGIMRFLALLRPWSMIEVCVVGILVSIIKLWSLAHVSPGEGMWAVGALMVLLPLIAGRDLRVLWETFDARPSEPSSAP